MRKHSTFFIIICLLLSLTGCSFSTSDPLDSTVKESFETIETDVVFDETSFEHHYVGQLIKEDAVALSIADEIFTAINAACTEDYPMQTVSFDEKKLCYLVSRKNDTDIGCSLELDVSKGGTVIINNVQMNGQLITADLIGNAEQAGHIADAIMATAYQDYILKTYPDMIEDRSQPLLLEMYPHQIAHPYAEVMFEPTKDGWWIGRNESEEDKTSAFIHICIGADGTIGNLIWGGE